MNGVTTSKLIEDLRILKSDLGVLVKATGVAIAHLRQPVGAKIAAARRALAERRSPRSSDAVTVDETARPRRLDSAWVAVAMATVIGIALGLLLRRRH